MLHHPDKGGDTALMQQVNTEFGKLFEVWKDKPCVSTAPTGYEHDFQDATAKEYTEYVYNEYRWKGRNYNGQSAPEITELVRAWLKETYPRYTFSVRRDGYSSILIQSTRHVLIGFQASRIVWTGQFLLRYVIRLSCDTISSSPLSATVGMDIELSRTAKPIWLA